MTEAELEHPFAITKIHRVAFRCRDARQTANWYSRVLGLKFTIALAEDHVPAIRAVAPYIHILLDADGGNVVAFTELPGQPEMPCDPNTPVWVQHIALEVPSLPALFAAKEHIEDQGIPVVGPTNHCIFQSICFCDPNGHRIQLTCNTATREQLSKLEGRASLILDEWSITKRVPIDSGGRQETKPQ